MASSFLRTSGDSMGASSYRPDGSAARRALAAGAAALLAACAPVPVRTGCSLPGAEPWREHRSAHFSILIADGDRDPAALVATFEELHAAILAALISEPVEIPGRVRVVIVPTRRELVDVTNARRVIGRFWISPRTGEPTVLLSAEDTREVPETVAHELVHHVSRHVFPRQPYWFGEGLAQFLEGLARKDAQGRRWAGADPASGWVAGSIKLTPVEALFSEGGASSDAFVTSWVLYRFLWNERAKQLGEYQRRLMEGEAPSAAWRAAFPEWDTEGHKIRFLDNDLAKHQTVGRGLRWQVDPGAVDRAFTTSSASSADVHMILLEQELEGVNPLVRPRLRRQRAEEALREVPHHPIAAAERAAADGTPALPALLESAAAHPQDARAWFLLALETDDVAEREAALRRAVGLWPDGFLPHAALAAHLAASGRAKEALPLANRAADLAPWDAGAVGTLARVALELRKCREALVLQERAVELAWGDAREGQRAALAEVRRRCAAASGPADAAPERAVE